MIETDFKALTSEELAELGVDFRQALKDRKFDTITLDSVVTSPRKRKKGGPRSVLHASRHRRNR